jgi:hypothetical protein
MSFSLLVNDVMPTYEFYNTTNGEQYSTFMSITEKEFFLEKNSHIQQIITAPNIIGGHGDRNKTDDGFKSVLAKVAEAHPNSNLADRIGTRSGKEVATQAVLKKHLDK